MHGYAFRNDASRKFTFDEMEISGPLPLGQTNLDAPCTLSGRVSVLAGDSRERRKCIIGMDNDVEVIHPRSAEAIKQLRITQPGISRESWISQCTFLLDSL